VIGVAKTAFANIGDEYKLLRGQSASPLYVTSVGMPLAEAKAAIQSMHGEFRIPTHLKRVDQLCRRSTSTLPTSARPAGK
jgi:deoxyribonuclease V